MRDAISVEELQALGRALASPLGEEEHTNTIVQARRLLKVRDREGRVQPLVANRAQQAFERTRGQKNIVLKARQMGMTTWVAARFFLKTITVPGTLTVQVAQTREAAESIFRIVQRFWDGLPEGYRTGPLKRSRANVRQMVFPHLDSEFRVLSAADLNAGRGLTIQNLHCSEVSRWTGDAYETLAGLRAALAPSGELALESTPNGAYGCFYDQWTGAEESGMIQHFFPWWLEEAYVGSDAKNFTEEEHALVQKHALSAAQIGFRRQLETSYRSLRSQEFAEDPERCFRATGDCCFEIEAIETRLMELADAPLKDRNGALQTWLPVTDAKEYVVAIDPAGGGSAGDYSVVQIIELGTGIQCAELREHIRLMELAKVAAHLARTYNNAMIVVERNNHGVGLHAFLQTKERYANLYESEGTEGFLTTAASKPRIVSLLGTLLVEQPGLFRSKRLLGECRTFVAQPNGSTGASAGAHDDCVMAMAIAQEVRSQRLQRPAKRHTVQYAA